MGRDSHPSQRQGPEQLLNTALLSLEGLGRPPAAGQGPGTILGVLGPGLQLSSTR